MTEQIAASIRLKHQLQRALTTIDAEHEPSSQTMIELIEVMITVQNPLTPEQFARLAAERATFAESLSDEELAAMAEHRRQYAAQLSPEELAAMQRTRAAMLPPELSPNPET